MNTQLSSGSKSAVKTAPHFMSNLFHLFGLHQNDALTVISPKIEVADNAADVVVTAELPGLSESDIDLEISSNGYLTISGERRHENTSASNEGCFSEISYGSFSRTIPLPWDLEYAAASADYANGVLSVTIPKTKQERSSRKKINLAGEKKTKRRTSAKAAKK
ncbi:MAG: Hsp20/alpha crystallin family protein [Alphaproteobacteria bacterium]|nr:Hsp20/alpha crystallin family protein [Alphaproteobacteria bacterium]